MSLRRGRAGAGGGGGRGRSVGRAFPKHWHKGSQRIQRKKSSASFSSDWEVFHFSGVRPSPPHESPIRTLFDFERSRSCKQLRKVLRASLRARLSLKGPMLELPEESASMGFSFGRDCFCTANCDPCKKKDFMKCMLLTKAAYSSTLPKTQSQQDSLTVFTDSS